MKKTRMLGSGMAVAALAALLAASWTNTGAGQGTADAIRRSIRTTWAEW